MKKNLTELVFILDRSGSMSGLESDTIGGFNAMIDKQKKQLNMKVQWTKLSIVLALYLLFLLWVKSWWGLLVVPFIFDVYITKKIRWQWWKPVSYTHLTLPTT